MLVSDPLTLDGVSAFLICLDSTFFWQNFWPNFAADLLATLIVGVGLVALIDGVRAKRRKIEARVRATVTRLSDSFQLDFVLANTGKVNFREREIFFHIWIAKSLGPTPPSHTDEVSIHQPYLHINRLLAQPAFSMTHTELISISVKNQPEGPRDLLYFLSTAYGTFPHHLETDSRGFVMSNQLGIVEIATEEQGSRA